MKERGVYAKFIQQNRFFLKWRNGSCNHYFISNGPGDPAVMPWRKLIRLL
jgi:carbamoylphosphate synthase small subunit